MIVSKDIWDFKISAFSDSGYKYSFFFPFSSKFYSNLCAPFMVFSLSFCRVTILLLPVISTFVRRLFSIHCHMGEYIWHISSAHLSVYNEIFPFLGKLWISTTSYGLNKQDFDIHVICPKKCDNAIIFHRNKKKIFLISQNYNSALNNIEKGWQTINIYSNQSIVLCLAFGVHHLLFQCMVFRCCIFHPLLVHFA